MSKKKKALPSKTTLNLVIKDRSARYYRNFFLGFLVCAILIAAFAKFAVIDRLAAAAEIERRAQAEQLRYDQLIDLNVGYEELRAEYEKYFKEVGSDAVYADILDVLTLVEKALMPQGDLQSAVMSKNELAVVLTGIDLEEAASIVQALYTHTLVRSVSLSSADTATGERSSVSMNIVLAVGGGEAT